MFSHPFIRRYGIPPSSLKVSKNLGKAKH